MALHLATLVKRERPWLLEQASRQADLANVVHETTEMSELLLLLVQRHARGNVPCVDRHRGRVTCRVLIPRVECGNQAVRERQVRGTQLGVYCLEIPREAPLLLVHEEPTLSGECRSEKQRKRPGRNVAIRER